MSILPAPFDSHNGLVVWNQPVTNQAQGTTNAQQPPTASSGQQNLGVAPIDLALPAIYITKITDLRVAQPVTTGSLSAFLNHEFSLSNLNCLHKHLWLAGLPQPARPLHSQIQVGRAIRVTEAADMHMLWHQSQIYLKPLPDLLLCHDIWTKYICHDQALYESAIGFLYSYLSLVCYPSDHQIATREGLLNPNISWQQWSAFTQALVTKGILDPMLAKNPRFKFGELRLGRIIWICRFCSVSKAQQPSLLRYYSYEAEAYTSFFRKNLDWLVTLFVYITIVLTAMQVGLGTNHLNSKQAFQDASWGFTIFSIIGPLIIIVAVAGYTVILILVNWIFTKNKKGKPRITDPCWQQQAMIQYKH